jgi:hypothetical protein
VSVYQIWGSFHPGDRRVPTTVSCFKKGELMGDGVKSMEGFEREFAKEDGEELVLMQEFDPAGCGKEMHQDSVVRQIFDMYMRGWWNQTLEEELKNDSHPSEPEADGSPPDLRA